MTSCKIGNETYDQAVGLRKLHPKPSYSIKEMLCDLRPIVPRFNTASNILQACAIKIQFCVSVHRLFRGHVAHCTENPLGTFTGLSPIPC